MKSIEEQEESTEKELHHMAVIEAILFMYGSDVPFTRLAQLTERDESDVRVSVEALRTAYEARSGGLRIIVTERTAQMVTQPSVAAVIEEITKKELEGPLTPVAMEVLAMIAYRGPIGKTDLEAIRGVNCAFTLRNLLRRGLIERVPQQEAQSRSHMYRVTADFLRVLGIAGVEELPAFTDLAHDPRINAILAHDSDVVDTETHDMKT